MTNEIDNTQDEDVQTQTIDDIFDADEAKQVDTSDEPEEETASEEQEAEDAHEPEEDAEPTAAKDELVPVKALIKALTEERRKRQNAEKRIKELEGKTKAPEKAPDPLDDPEAYADYNETRINNAALKTKISLSRDVMLDAKDDYEEKEGVFVKLAKERPYLIHQMNAHPNPAKFAYQTAIDHLDAEKYKDPNYLEKLKDEIRQEILQEQSGKKTGKKSALEVPDLTKATAAGKNSDPGEAVETLEDMFEGSAL